MHRKYNMKCNHEIVLLRLWIQMHLSDHQLFWSLQTNIICTCLYHTRYMTTVKRPYCLFSHLVLYINNKQYLLMQNNIISIDINCIKSYDSIGLRPIFIMNVWQFLLLYLHYILKYKNGMNDRHILTHFKIIRSSTSNSRTEFAGILDTCFDP